MPALLEGSYSEALAAGRSRNCPVLLYLQSDLHADTSDFLKSTFCTRAVCEAVEREGVQAWGGRVHEPDGWEAALRLEASGFPFLGLYVQNGSSSSSSTVKYKRLWAQEGGPLLSAEALAAEIRKACSSARAGVERVSASERHANYERLVRETQER